MEEDSGLISGGLLDSEMIFMRTGGIMGVSNTLDRKRTCTHHSRHTAFEDWLASSLLGAVN